MTNTVLLMAGGTGFILLVLAVLVLGGGITFLVIKEKNRKAKAREKAEERRKLREEALRKAREGQVDAFEALTNTEAAKAEAAARKEAEAKAQRAAAIENNSEKRHEQSLKSRTADLETLRLVRLEAEAESEEENQAAADTQQEEAVKEEAASKEPVVEEKSKVDFKALAGKLAAVEDLEGSTVVAAPAEAEETTEEKSEESVEETIEAAPVENVEEAASAAVETVSEAVEDVDIDCTPNFRTEEEKQDTSAFKPYRDEYEDLADQYEQQTSENKNGAVIAAAAGAAIAAAAAVIPAISEAVSEDEIDEDEAVELTEVMDEASEAKEPVIEESAAEETETAFTENESAKVEAAFVQEPIASEDDNLQEEIPASAAPAMLTEDEERAERIRNAAILAGSTAAIDTMALTAEEKAAAREARMAEKAKYAAALAGEVDIEDVKPAVRHTRKAEAEPEDLLEEEETEGKTRKTGKVFLWILAVILMLVCACAILYLLFGDKLSFGKNSKQPAVESSLVQEMEETQPDVMVTQAEAPSQEESLEESPAMAILEPEVSETPEEPEPEPEPEPAFTSFCEEPHPVDSTQPSKFGTNWVISNLGEIVDEYKRDKDIEFLSADDYAEVNGVLTFRGNNFRNDPTYGDANLTGFSFNGADWVNYTGGLAESDGYVWSGCGWTGQPLIVEWDAQTRKNMTSLYDDKKTKEGFVEVIYATLDGEIYFFDLEDGSASRDPMDIGMTFKGAGALDPRGIPLMYVGSGVYNAYGDDPRMYVINLIDCTIAYEAGPYDEIAYREWPAFDSSPLVNAETDTLIWPGENGVFYTIKLNTDYNKATGKLTVEPEQVAKMAYDFERSGFSEYWYGMECSVACFEHYAYISENGGMFFCLDLNTMEIVWAQDTLDDSNSTPVFQFDETTGRGYLYTAPSLHWTKEGDTGNIPIFKIDAITGEIIWQKEYYCYTVEDISGGVQSTPAIGRDGTNVEDIIFYTIARWDWYDDGLLVALDCESGEEVWRYEMEEYTWSSPVLTYDADGNGYLIMFDSVGNGFFMDAATGEILDTCYLGALVEASPALYNDKLVVGTRDGEMYCLDLE